MESKRNRGWKQMIVVEDIEASEIHRFLVVDASLRLGIVRAGKSIQTFDPDRAFAFYAMVDNQVHDYAKKYSGAFKFLPRRAYDYLKEPHILREFYHGVSEPSCSSWLVDLLMTKPLIRIGDSILPDGQKEANAESVRRWANLPPHSPRVYGLQDMRLGRRTPSGWGCIVDAKDLGSILKGSNRNDLLTHIKAKRPVFVEMGEPEDLDSLLEWLVLIKEAGLTTPRTILSVRDHRAWSRDIGRLVEIPSSAVLTSGGTISSISSIIRRAKKEHGDSWSNHIMFASAYPETHLGDSISEVLSYLLSRNLSATPEEVQRILGGNILFWLPPRPPHLHYSDNPTSVMAEEALGKPSMNEMIRILQILRARGVLCTNSVDYTVESEGGRVFLDGAVVTVMDPVTEKATSLSLLIERSGALMISGWKRAFTDALVRRDSLLLRTLVRANAKLDGPIYGSPAHIARFDEALLKCLQVSSPRDVMSALHFGVEIAKTERGIYLMAPSDMESIEVRSGDRVLILDTKSGQWYAGTVREHERCREKTIVVSEEDADLFGLRTSSVVNVAKFDGEVTNLSKVVLSCDSDLTTSAEALSHLHLHRDEVLNKIQGMLVGKDTVLQTRGAVSTLTLRIAETTPRLDTGHVGLLQDAETILRLSQTFSEIDVVLCISTGKQMRRRDVELATPGTVRASLQPLGERIPEVKEFVSRLEDKSSRAEISALGALLVLNQILHNRSDGRLGLITFAETSDKFTIQRGDIVQNYVRFREDLASEEVLVSLIYSILDTIKSSGGAEETSTAYRSIAEYLEDFGSERPTLVIMFSGGIGTYDDDHLPVLRSIAEQERYKLQVYKMGGKVSPSDLRILKGLNAEVIETDRFAGLAFEGHLIDTIEEMIPSASRPHPES
ncbi:MAG: hypothetical protein ACTSV3_03265 [Candidatus Thorarchaeota archaeon]